MAVMREETFGPVLPVMRVPDAEAALRAANDSPMGLVGQHLVGRRAGAAAALARRLQAGSVCVNDVLVNYFCVEAPLGGIKASGIGFRHGPEALRQFCRLETIIEDHPLLGWLSPLLGRELTFPYKPRTQRLLRRFMRLFLLKRSTVDSSSSRSIGLRIAPVGLERARLLLDARRRR